MTRTALFSGTQDDPFASFEGAFDDDAAAMPTVERLEDGGSFCALVPIGTEHASYTTA